MGKVKQWAMEEQENAMNRYAEGKIDNKKCIELLAKFGMDTDDIEIAIDDLTADHTKAVAEKAIEKSFNMWTAPRPDWTFWRKK